MNVIRSQIRIRKMTEEDIKIQEAKYSETKIQHTCVGWFRTTFPHVAGLLFAIPNGGARTRTSGFLRQYEGAIAGIADLILLFPCGGKCSLCIEMKTPRTKGKSAGRQSPEQKEWQKLIENNGSVYVVCHGLIEFIRSVCDYLKADPQPYINDVLRNYYKLI